MKWALSIVAALVLIGAVLHLGGQRVAPRPLSLVHNGVHGVTNRRDARGDLVFYNFRAVEPGVLYRGSGFPRNRLTFIGGVRRKQAAAFADNKLYNFFRGRNIRTIIDLQEPDAYYAEQGYFDYWNNTRAYRALPPVKVVRLSVKSGHAYDKNGRALMKYPDLEERRFGLRAASEFIAFMKARRPGDGAVYVHCDAGKDRTGVVCAAYELWRNQGRVPRDELWSQVMARYLVSNVVIAKDKKAALFAGGTHACGAGQPAGFVCAGWLQALRPQLETIAQVG